MSVEPFRRESKQPKCPDCGVMPLNFSHNIFPTTAGAMMSISWCSDCGHTLAIQFVGQGSPDAPTRIVRPS